MRNAHAIGEANQAQGDGVLQKNSQMRWQRLDVEIAAMCLEAMFSLPGEGEA